MKWMEVFIETTQEGIEIVCGLLYNMKITGLIIEDKEDFRAFLEDPDKKWDYVEADLLEEKEETKTGITFFVQEDLEGAEILSTVKSNLQALKTAEKEIDLGTLSASVKNIEEKDWANNWKKYFKPFNIGEKITIKPSWEVLEKERDRVVLEIDPGQIFGTGSHETTKGCIEYIEKYVKLGDKILDLGCGSGILSIASILLGANHVDAVDIDIKAQTIVAENMELNKISASNYNVYIGNILENEELVKKFSGKKYDIVEANIIADVIIALCNMVPNFLKKDGVFIASGIIEERLDDVIVAMKNTGFAVLDKKDTNGWVAITCRYEG